MTPNEHNHREQKPQPTAGAATSTAQPESRPAAPSDSAGPSQADRDYGPAPKGPIVKFIALFGLLIAGSYAFSVSETYPRILDPYLRLNAKVSAVILNVFGENARSEGNILTSARFGVTIARGCDALGPSALFASAVLAFPAAIRFKLWGVIAGTALLIAINLVRIISLFYIGIYLPTYFDTMHHDVWQALFIFLALLFWIIWASWVTRGETQHAHAAG